MSQPVLKDVNFEDMVNDFTEAYDTAQSMAHRLGELNKEIIEYLSGQAIAKAAQK